MKKQPLEEIADHLANIEFYLQNIWDAILQVIHDDDPEEEKQKSDVHKGSIRVRLEK